MATNPPIVSSDGRITKKSETQGIDVVICNPTWFDVRKSYVVSNASDFAKNLEFSGADLNFAARVLFAEATGSGTGIDADELFKEKSAILHVMYIRLNRKGYPNNKYVATSFEMVGRAPQLQFESVARDKPKFLASAAPTCQTMNRANCTDLQLCIDAINMFIKKGPNFLSYPFDEFRSAKQRPNWHVIAQNAFHISNLGDDFLVKMKETKIP